ncbi:hypothetical protein E4P40_03520 [Blastococcus sp. CT_GayMR20]|uniref:hypothetical protein n=1 Tax=Blastococcus sp. CT_GayMR20 TaxID=2559609 RepID=UPI00107419E4|nr:hypothetical protein [Blastococcus sp. CT_GayMR20]TFV92277.1 hypothetical protein E4P40_03520 [Blastococcus sp. CT_GayMR20]
MPNSELPAEDTSAAPSMPTSVRVAIVAMGVLAALLLLSGGLLWYGYDTAVETVMESSNASRSEATRFVTLSLVPYLALGLLLALSAWFLPRRQPWARWLGLAAATLLGLLTVFNVVVSGGVTFYSLLVLVLSIAAVTSLLARTTTDYVPSLRARA